MQFSETDQPWRPIPEWVNYLIQFGYQWPAAEPSMKRIALISMPCDSAAAGLITLGAMIRDLGNATASNVNGHYGYLLKYAKQFLGACSRCDLHPCQPEKKGCGYVKRADGKMRSSQFANRSLTISNRTDFEANQLALEYPRAHDGPGVWQPSPAAAATVHICGEPPPVLGASNGALAPEPYSYLIDGVNIQHQNLSRSYSGLCLAGRASGENTSRDTYATLRFCDAEKTYRLDEMLTVSGWSGAAVSRVLFYNSRIEEADRYAFSPELVVADGDAAFLKAAGRTEFQHSDLLGVIHRVMEREKLETIGNKMAEWRQWYEPDLEFEAHHPPPYGIGLSILKKRQA
jgi:hypothetical protein